MSGCGGGQCLQENYLILPLGGVSYFLPEITQFYSETRKTWDEEGEGVNSFDTCISIEGIMCLYRVSRKKPGRCFVSYF